MTSFVGTIIPGVVQGTDWISQAAGMARPVAGAAVACAPHVATIGTTVATHAPAVIETTAKVAEAVGWGAAIGGTFAYMASWATPLLAAGHLTKSGATIYSTERDINERTKRTEKEEQLVKTDSIVMGQLFRRECKELDRASVDEILVRRPVLIQHTLQNYQQCFEKTKMA